MTDKNIFDATSSALGYIYQVRYALFLALKKVADANDPDDCFISIEKLDDIAFEENGDPVELLQSKYHGSPGNLTDRSTDLWKTVRVWSEMIANQDVALEEVTFTLLTTEGAMPDSIASHLGIDEGTRNIQAALVAMRSISQESENATNKKAYVAFNALESWQQEGLLNAIYVIGNSPHIVEVEEKIKRQIRLSASAHHVDAFTSRLEGLWFKRVIEVMSFDDQGAISIGELVNIIDDLRSQFLPGNLPSDFDDIDPEEIDIKNDGRTFVEQLRLIDASNRVIRNAIINYYRAFEQRSRWSRENLVKPGELQKYLNRLKDEWENQSSLVEMAHDFSQEQQKVVSGQKLYTVCQGDSALPIRPEFKSAYVARGSYHTLSDNKVIGWHTNYIDLLEPSNDQGAA
jgi:hypothetical protein